MVDTTKLLIASIISIILIFSVVLISSTYFEDDLVGKGYDEPFDGDLEFEDEPFDGDLEFEYGNQGDVSGQDGIPDGEINVADAVAMVKHFLISDFTLTENGMKNADVNCNGEFNLSDAIKIVRHFLLDESLNC